MAPWWAGATPWASPERLGAEAVLAGNVEAWTGDRTATPMRPSPRPTPHAPRPQRQWSPLPMPLPPPSPPAPTQLHGAHSGWDAGGLCHVSQRQDQASDVALLARWHGPPKHMLQAQPGAGPWQQHVQGQEANSGPTAPPAAAAESAACGLVPGGLAAGSSSSRVAGSGGTAHTHARPAAANAAVGCAANVCLSIPAIRPCVFHCISSSDADSRTAISLRQAHIPLLFPGMWRRLQAHLVLGRQVRSSRMPVTLVLASLPESDPGREVQVGGGWRVCRVPWAARCRWAQESHVELGVQLPCITF